MKRDQIQIAARKIYESDDALYQLSTLGVQLKQGKDADSVFVAAGWSASGTASEPAFGRNFRTAFTMSRPIRFSAKFTREKWLQKLGAAMLDEPQVDEPLFDKQVFIDTNDTVRTLATLSERCQAAIMLFTGHPDEFVVVEPTKILIQGRIGRGELPPGLDDPIVIAAHFAQWCGR